MPIPAIDVSSYQPRDLAELVRAHNTQHVVVRLYLPGERVSQEHSRAQIASARAAGCSVGGYVWCYHCFDARKTVADGVALAQSCNVRLPVLWLDCETYLAGSADEDPGPDAAWLQAAIAESRRLGVQPGIYTGGWWWRARMENTAEFGDLPLWAAQYDDADLATFKPFGGWKAAAGKQWTDAPIDQDVFDAHYTRTARTVEELTRVNPNLPEQLRVWQSERRVNGQDPWEYPAFRAFLQGLTAPDTSEEEFDGFCPAALATVRRENSQLGAQLSFWQRARRTKGEDPHDYQAFRAFLSDLNAPDPGPTPFETFWSDAKVEPEKATEPRNDRSAHAPPVGR